MHGLKDKPKGWLSWLTTTDHKRIGIMYLFVTFLFFILGGVEALIMRVQLAVPDGTAVTPETYNGLVSMHGTTMIFLFVVPVFAGFANYFVPLMIGARDMAFPRLNALSLWLLVFGGIAFYASLFFQPPQAGWTSYAPLSDDAYMPSGGIDAWIFLIHLTGLSSLVGAINFIATIHNMRAKGMGWGRMPLFVWSMLTYSYLLVAALPTIAAAATMLLTDRHFGTDFFDATGGGDPVLWQHLFWFFGHPEVYIIVLPFFGVVTEIIPVFSRKPVFGYKGIVLATLSIAGLSVGVWAHHMFTTGAVLLPFFSGFSFLIAVPTGVKFFNWIGTMWRGQISFAPPMLFAIGFMVVFLLGGLSGVLLASAPIDFHTHDTYFVVAHMHYVLFGSAVFAGFGGVYYWFPKWTGKLMRTGPAKLHFVLLFAGFNLTFFPQHLLGLRGMVRRVADYAPQDGFTFLNFLSTTGAGLLAVSTLPFLWNLWVSMRRGEPSGDDPWGGHTLEWATSSPPPEHNFTSLPPIRSDRPVFDARMAAARRTVPGGDGPPPGDESVVTGG
ncbi:MAG: cytochrome c oxidase subunit I [Acidimicrobiales bacterium]